MILKDSTLERRLERLGLSGQQDYWAGRYVLCNHLVDPASAGARQKFEAASRFLRDLIAHRWVRTRQAREDAASKRIHYLSMEFLLGRTLRNNMMNLGVEHLVRDTLQEAGWDLDELIGEEPDAGLGNGGLGRLAACFIDSLATLQYPAIGLPGAAARELRAARIRPEADPWPAVTPPRGSLRPAGGGLWRSMHQHAAAVGRGRTGPLQLR